jgi:hypothetical protein
MPFVPNPEIRLRNSVSSTKIEGHCLSERQEDEIRAFVESRRNNGDSEAALKAGRAFERSVARELTEKHPQSAILSEAKLPSLSELRAKVLASVGDK